MYAKLIANGTYAGYRTLRPFSASVRLIDGTVLGEQKHMIDTRAVRFAEQVYARYGTDITVHINGGLAREQPLSSARDIDIAVFDKNGRSYRRADSGPVMAEVKHIASEVFKGYEYTISLPVHEDHADFLLKMNAISFVFDGKGKVSGLNWLFHSRQAYEDYVKKIIRTNEPLSASRSVQNSFPFKYHGMRILAKIINLCYEDRQRMVSLDVIDDAFNNFSHNDGRDEVLKTLFRGLFEPAQEGYVRLQHDLQAERDTWRRIITGLIGDAGLRSFESTVIMYYLGMVANPDITHIMFERLVSAPEDALVRFYFYFNMMRDLNRRLFHDSVLPYSLQTMLHRMAEIVPEVRADLRPSSADEGEMRIVSYAGMQPQEFLAFSYSYRDHSYRISDIRMPAHISPVMREYYMSFALMNLCYLSLKRAEKDIEFVFPAESKVSEMVRTLFQVR